MNAAAGSSQLEVEDLRVGGKAGEYCLGLAKAATAGGRK